MSTIDEVLAAPRPRTVAQARANWPVRDTYHPSPADWRDECLYFLLPDRFSDETPPDRPLLPRTRLRDARGGSPDWSDDQWQAWAASGRLRFQGGTLAGARSRLDYLADLGVTTLWVGPVWKQRRHSFVNDDGQQADEYHGYAVQDFLDVDPRFGTRADLVDLVREAHDRRMRVVLDVIINHTGRNWLYRSGDALVPVQDDPLFTDGAVYEFGAWLDGDGRPMPPTATTFADDDAVWPEDLRDPTVYHRRGQIVRYDDRLPDGSPNFADDAQFRLGDMTNRDLALEAPGGEGREQPLQAMIACWTYWISLTDCDGFRIDTLKHCRLDDARMFCGAVKEYAETLGKRAFLVAGEIAGGDDLEQAYLGAIATNLDVALELGVARRQLRDAALGTDASGYLGRYHAPPSDPAGPQVDPSDGPPDGPFAGSHRAAGSCFVTTLDDHDDVGLTKQRFPSLNRITPAPGAQDCADYYPPLQAVPGVALLLLGLGIPCLYYGTEQGLAAAAIDQPTRLPAWTADDRGGDRYLREAMFGPAHPRRAGAAGFPDAAGGPLDAGEPGFGPFGTTGHHVFDPNAPTYRRIRALLGARKAHPALRLGRQYPRPATVPGTDPARGTAVPGIVAWSRILAWQEVVVVADTTPPVTSGPPSARDVHILVDADLNPVGASFTVVASTAGTEGLAPQLFTGASFAVGRFATGAAGITVPGLPSQEVVVLARDTAR